MGSDDVSIVLRLIGFPLWVYGMVALFRWSARTAPKGQVSATRGPYTWPRPEAGLPADRSVAKALAGTDQQSKPPLRVTLCLACGIFLSFIGIVVGLIY